MLELLKKFEKAVTVTLVVLMAVVLLLATIELGWIIIKDIITPPVFLLEIEELLDIFGLFLLVLIGVELLETIKAYLKENVVHFEVVLTVAMIAIARKVITLDVKELPSMTLVGRGRRPMKAAVFNRYGGNEVVEVKDMPVPAPARGEVVIKVRAASVNPGGLEGPRRPGEDIHRDRSSPRCWGASAPARSSGPGRVRRSSGRATGWSCTRASGGSARSPNTHARQKTGSIPLLTASPSSRPPAFPSRA